MEEREFRRLLDYFPIVRSPNYCAESERESSSHSAQNEITDWQNAWSEMDKKGEVEEIDYKDPFWQKLRSAAEKKVGSIEADRFCKALQTVHKQLVYKELSLDAARRFIGADGN